MSTEIGKLTRNGKPPPEALQPDLPAIGKRFAEVRNALGWLTQSLAALELNSLPKIIRNIENGKTLPSAEILYKLSIYGVSAEYILHGVGDMQRRDAVSVLRDDEKAFLEIYNRVDEEVKLILRVLLAQKFPR